MSFVARFGLSLSLLASSFACKHNDNAQLNASDASVPASAKQVLILLGGFGSCGSDERNKATPISGLGAPGSMNKIRETLISAFEGKPDRVFSTCYAVEYNAQMKLPEIGAYNLFMVDSANPTVVEKLPPEAMLNKIIGKLSEPELQKAQVHVVGHSYGGWSAMKLLQQTVQKFKLATEQPFQIKTFVTLDPVSKTECYPKVIFDHVIALQKDSKGQPLPQDLTPVGCRRAPVEFNSDLKAMSCRVAVWKNYYQENSGILASSAIGSGMKLPITNIDLMTIPTERDPRAFQKGTLGGHLAFLKEDPLLSQVKGLIAAQQKKPFALQAGCSL